MEKLLSIFLFIFLTCCCSLSQQFCSSNFERSFQSSHNGYRALHRSRPLTLDQGAIRKWAQKQAEWMAGTDNLNPPKGPYGTTGYKEYIGAGSGNRRIQEPDSRRLVSSWYNKGQNMYQRMNWYGLEPDMRYFKEVGAFTQIVWRNTSSLAVGCSLNRKTGYFYVFAAYYAPGNMVGEFRRNVLQPAIAPMGGKTQGAKRA